MKKFQLLAASAIILLSATPAWAQIDSEPAATQNQEAAAPESPGGGIPEIVVTAERQSERLQDVPIAVSAFTAQNLHQQQIVNPAALEQSLPNVSFTKTNFTISSFTIRGIGDLCTGTTCDSATGIAVNDMPLVSTRLFESEFYDLERIEVLRGPQGTLFGRNATAGVVNFITAKPDLSGMHANGEFEYGNYNSKKLKAMFNLPVGDTIGVRLAGLWLNRGGFTKNIYNDTKIDGRKLYSLRGTLSWEPDSDTRLDLIGYYFHEKDDRSRSQKQLCHRDPTGFLGCLPDRLANQTTNGNATLGTIFSSNEFLSIATNGARIPGTPYPFAALGLGSIYGTDVFSNAVTPSDNRTVALDYNPIYYAEEQRYEAKFFHDFGTISLSLTGGYAQNKVDSRSDYFDAVENPIDNNSGLLLLAGLAAAGGGAANPFVALANTLIPNGPAGGLCQSDLSSNEGGVYSGASVGCYHQSLDFDRSRADARQWSAEAHISSHFDGMFDFLLGGIYLDQKIINNDYFVGSGGLDYASGLLGIVFPGGGSGYFLGTPFFRNDEDTYRLKSYGLFGESYLDFTDKLKLTLGIRYNHDSKYLNARALTLSVPAAYGTTTISDVAAPFQISGAKFNRLTGRVVLDYKITPRNLIYASYSRGYKSGGVNPPVSAIFNVKTLFKPEAVNAFEIGSKNTFLNGTLQLNLTGFYYQYNDLQLARIVQRTAVNDNISADIYGLEAEAIISPVRDFVVNANISYLHSKVSQDEYLVNPRDPSSGRADVVIIKDIMSASNCAVTPTTAGNAVGANAFVNLVNSNALGLQETRAIPGTTTTGAFSSCSVLHGLADNTTDPASTLYALQQGINAAFGLGAFTVNDGSPVNVRGNRLPQAPTYKFAVGAQYSFHTNSNWTIVPRVDLNYSGNSYASIFNNQIDRLKGYAIINAQLTINGPDNHWYLRGFVNNLTNNSAITGQYVTDQSTGLFTNVFTIEPRQFGAAIGFNF